MKLASALLLGACLLPAQRPKVTREAIQAVEKNFDHRLERELPENPFLLLGTTRGVYLAGYGAIFTAEINLAAGPGLSPFRPRITKEEVAALHKRKLERLPIVKRVMREMLVSAAGALDTVPPEERLVFGLTLFRFSWEDSGGIPAQILVQAPRKLLLQYQTGKNAGLEAAVPAEEF